MTDSVKTAAGDTLAYLASSNNFTSAQALLIGLCALTFALGFRLGARR